MNNMEENTIEENWTYFKKIILQATKELIPQKTIGSKQHLLWISTHIKRLIRRRERRYIAAKKHNTKKNWNKYKQMRDLVKKTMNKAHDNYVRQILNQEDEENTKPSLGKKFWKYLKSRKKDTMGISPLQNNLGEHVIDSKGKSEILDTQYDSVFTTEDIKNMPNMGTKMVQRRAARFATSTYSREPGTVTTIMKTLEWQTLESRRKSGRLNMLYKATHGKAEVNIPSYVRRPSTSTRQYHPEKFTQISISTDAYKYSYIPRTITDWNSLPFEAFQATSLECSKEQLRRLQL
ncbi:unnamed protein product [Mytilus coruscus]|uniref:Uncharacterized protein n=1 Tax=Mytilus coruscus TaxID=42192 RepID=A0A6J8BZ08_MYTCO|nr:unnamed protein product [Mytilus coruscus]